MKLKQESNHIVSTAVVVVDLLLSQSSKGSPALRHICHTQALSYDIWGAGDALQATALQSPGLWCRCKVSRASARRLLQVLPVHRVSTWFSCVLHKSNFGLMTYISSISCNSPPWPDAEEET